ncbi:MAG TPA: hypothetical protein VFQ07_06070, partial [Candidatus Polarisedimenticolia bacterium]|nr:hypothetical protein [Candidatus Polarisedimenticolia bacterium]
MVSITFPDPVLLRRASARLVRRPGEYGDLFLEGTALATVVRQGGEETAADTGSAHGAAARLMTPEGRTRHLAADAVDADTILSLADRIDGGGGSGLPAVLGASLPAGGGRAGMVPAPAPAGQVAPGRAAAAAAIRAYLTEVER